MATSTAQRTGIWIIAIAMIVGTVVGFIVMILSSQDQQKQQEALSKYNQEYTAYQSKITAQTTTLSNKYYPVFKPYKSAPAKFDAKSVKKLTTKDLKIGTGAVITSKSNYDAYYILWNSEGKTKDSSFDTGNKLKAPLDTRQAGTLISGWSKGVVGMRVGGIRELTIPASEAYNSTTAPSADMANIPLKFIVYIIPSPPTVDPPKISQEVLDAYSAQQQ